MPAGINDKISKVSSGVRPVSTTVSTIRNSGATTLACADLTGWTTTEVVFFVTYKIDGSGKVIVGSQSDWKGIVSGSNINNLVLTGGSDAGNAAGDIVEMLPTAEYAKQLATNILIHANQDGTLLPAAVTTALNASPAGTAQLGDNSVTTAKIASTAVNSSKIDFGGGGAGIWWEEIGRTTLGAPGDTISVTIAARKYLTILVSVLPMGGTIEATMRFNSDAASNYAVAVNTNGTTGAAGSQAQLSISSSASANQKLFTITANNILAQEKSINSTSLEQSGAGAGAAPGYRITYGKWANTSTQITSVQVLNTGTGDFAIGSEVVVLGHN